MQSEGVEISTKMEFLTQQNIMPDLENKALKQRMECLPQEQLIKRCEYSPLIYFFLSLNLLSTQIISVITLSFAEILIMWQDMHASLWHVI